MRRRAAANNLDFPSLLLLNKQQQQFLLELDFPTPLIRGGKKQDQER